MKKSNYSAKWFWARQIGLALILIIIAVVVIQLRKSNINAPSPVGEPAKRSVATGLSAFYQEFRLSSSDPIKDQVGDFVLELNPSETPLDERLRSMKSDMRPVSGRWAGEKKYRTFKAGGTLRETLSSFSQQEGMQVIWDLPQDFVVKHQFQVESTISAAVQQIAAAIDSNFEGDVKGYICPEQRSIVMTTNHTNYVLEHCVVTN